MGNSLVPSFFLLIYSQCTSN